MHATEQLKKEHEGIKLMLSIMDEICNRLEAGKKVSTKDIDSIIEFIKTFADKCHHAKEEDLLFPAMEEAGIPREEGPIAVMLMEHDQGRSYVKGLGEAAAKYKDGDQKAAGKIIENARNYINLLTQHIDKEENILYNIADMHISEKEQKELLKKFDKIEIERIGKGKHEKFHKLLQSLKKAYL